MITIPPGAIVGLVIGVVVIVAILIILLVCCLCHQCEQCARWSRKKGITRDELRRDRELTESRREFEEIRQQHNTTRDEIRAKYNLNTNDSNIRVVP